MSVHLIDLYNRNKLDEIMNQYSVDEVANQLDFKNAIKLAWRMLFNDYDAYQQSEFGVNLLFALKEIRSDIWNSDWRYDALLGVACDNTYRYDERFEAFKSAYDKAKAVQEDDNPGLLINLAGCFSAPGTPPISEDEALALVKKAMKDKIYRDGAWELSAIYHSKGDMENHKKWKEMAQKLDNRVGELGPYFYPRFLWDEEISPKK